MRLARSKRSSEGTGHLVAEVPSPTAVASPDLQLLFLEAYRRLHGRVLDHAERFLSTDDARDAVGDAMEVLWRKWASLSPDKRNDRYVFGIVSHCVHAKLRENSRLVSLEEAEPELDQRAVRAGFARDWGDTAADVLDAALAVMPPRRREVFLLVKEQAFTRQEAADALGLSVETIGTHMRLATEDLRAAFTRAGFQLPGATHPRLPSPQGGDAND